MSRPAIKLPWIATSERPPEKGAEVLWMDVDGSYHLAKWDGKHVLPVVYGNADAVQRRLDEHVCWMSIQHPDVIQ